MDLFLQFPGTCSATTGPSNCVCQSSTGCKGLLKKLPVNQPSISRPTCGPDSFISNSQACNVDVIRIQGNPCSRNSFIRNNQPCFAEMIRFSGDDCSTTSLANTQDECWGQFIPVVCKYEQIFNLSYKNAQVTYHSLRGGQT